MSSQFIGAFEFKDQNKNLEIIKSQISMNKSL